MSTSVALVTGGTTGIGRASAMALARRGYAVVFTGRRKEEGEETLRLIRGARGVGCFVQGDVSQERDIERLMGVVAERFGRLDCAFNNAGVEGDRMVPIEGQRVENIERVLGINLIGAMLCMKHEVPLLLRSGGGAIVNNASVAGMVGIAGMSTYAASKHGVIGATRSVALETAAKGIRVNSISPGGVHTEMIERFYLSPEAREKLGRAHPMKRLGTPEEVAELVAWLCSPSCGFVTGANIPIDGGWTAV